MSTAPALRERILQAFAERAKRSSVRSVLMADVAQDVRISTRTLYQVFAGKAELVAELIERRTAEVRDDLVARLRGPGTTIQRVEAAIEAWLFYRGSDFSAAFLEELQRDHARAFESFVAARTAVRMEWLRFLRTVVRPEFRAAFAFELLDAAVRRAVDPVTLRRYGLSRRQAVHRAVDLWASGALG